MNSRVVDWSLAAAIAIAFASGILSLVSGRAEDWWVFVVHGLAGLWLAPLTAIKLWRVWPRLLRPRAWDRRTIFGALTTLLTLLSLVCGVAWTTGGTLVVAGYNLLNWHIIFSLLLVVAVSAHMLARARPLARRHLAGRRQALRWAATLAGGVLLWPAGAAAARALDTPGARRRFTGSREVGSFGGNGSFPYVAWVADHPGPIDPAGWQLRVAGLVGRELTPGLDALAAPRDELEATLDCTGGFFTTQRWGGSRVGRLLDGAGVLPGARYVRFVSVTGYRWSLPLAEAREALLATHLGGAPLAHGHGAPARLVAPGRRGFEWVKWVVAVEVLAEPDPGQLWAIWTSGFTAP